jgi:hypothetical protein
MIIWIIQKSLIFTEFEIDPFVKFCLFSYFIVMKDFGFAKFLLFKTYFQI